MISPMRGGGMLLLKMLALGWGIWIFTGSSALADDGDRTSPMRTRWERKSGLTLFGQRGQHRGTLGYGPPGLHPGFQGFGLGFHPGYGYGGNGLGVGASGGYPFYGGPGYPHPWPYLRRFGGITPFPHYGGPGAPSPDHPNYFGGVGPLVADKPVIQILSSPGEASDTSGYGYFTGALPYPESVLAPFTSAAAAGGSASGVSISQPTSIPTNPAPAD